MPDVRKTIELILTGKNQLRPVMRDGTATVKFFATGAAQQVGRVARAVFNLRNLIAATSVGYGLKQIFDPAIELQTMETQLAVLLGSVAKAKERLADLEQFAASTPFELPGIVQASRTLEVFTKGALSQGDALRMVGDAASASNQPIEELAVWFGRLYDGLQSGRPVGEALMRLQELAVISGEARGKIEDLQKAGAAGDAVWGVVTSALEKYAGMTERVSQTTAGRLSTLRDNWRMVRKEVGEGALPALNDAVEDLLTTLQDLRESGQLQEWGEDTRQVLQGLWDTVQGIAGFVADNRRLLATLGFTAVGLRLLWGLTSGLIKMRAALAVYTASQAVAAAATNTTTVAMGAQTTMASTQLAAGLAKAAGALRALGLIAGAAFAGWGVGRVIANVLDLDAKLAGLWVRLGDLDATGAKGLKRPSQEVLGKDGAFMALAGSGGSDAKLNAYWEGVKARMRGGGGDTRDDFERRADEQEQGLQAAAAAHAAAQQRAANATARAEAAIAEQRQVILDRIAAMERDGIRERAMAEYDAQIEGARQREAALREEARILEGGAQELHGRAQAAFEFELLPRERQRAMRREAERRDDLEEDIAAARAKEDRKKRLGFRYSRAADLTKREQRLLVIDDLRRQAGALRGQAGAAGGAADDLADYGSLVSGAKAEAQARHARMDRAAQAAQLAARLPPSADGLGGADAVTVLKSIETNTARLVEKIDGVGGMD